MLVVNTIPEEWQEKLSLDDDIVNQNQDNKSPLWFCDRWHRTAAGRNVKKDGGG